MHINPNKSIKNMHAYTPNYCPHFVFQKYKIFPECLPNLNCINAVEMLYVNAGDSTTMSIMSSVMSVSFSYYHPSVENYVNILLNYQLKHKRYSLEIHYSVYNILTLLYFLKALIKD